MATKKDASLDETQAVPVPVTEAPPAAVDVLVAPAAPEPEKCPYCAATIFQGPFIRGLIINGAIVERERLFQCVGCNQVMNLERIQKPI